MADEGHDTGIAARKSKSDPYVEGFVLTIVFSVLAWTITMFALVVWLETLGIKPDFTTNGLLNVSTTILTVDFFFLPVFFGLWMILIIPFFLQNLLEGDDVHAAKVKLHLAMGVVLVVLRTILYYDMTEVSLFGLWLAQILPVLLCALAGGEILVRRGIRAKMKKFG